MKPFHTYVNGLRPGPPGYFATDRSVDQNGTAVRIGDIINNRAEFDRPHGVVVGIYGETLVFLVDAPAPDTYVVGELSVCDVSHALIIGHVYDLLREVARIEALADAAGRKS